MELIPGGRILWRGKICSLDRDTSGGFCRGEAVIERILSGSSGDEGGVQCDGENGRRESETNVIHTDEITPLSGEPDGGDTLTIAFQNEFLKATLAQKKNKFSEQNVAKVLGAVPDLISVLDLTTGEPIFTEELRFGLRVAVVLLPGAEQMKTARARQIVGLAAFGYDASEYAVLRENMRVFDVIREFGE